MKVVSEYGIKRFFLLEVQFYIEVVPLIIAGACWSLLWWPTGAKLLLGRPGFSLQVL